LEHWNKFLIFVVMKIIKKMINYDIQGFFDGKQKVRVQRKFAKNLNTAFRGYKINEFQINSTINSQKEFEKFIEFIEIIRPCISNDR